MASVVIKLFAIFVLIGISVLESEAANNVAKPARAVKPFVSTNCLNCICHALSDCKRGLQCHGNVCGIYGMTRQFWIDAGKPTVSKQSPNAPDAYKNCAVHPHCAERTIQRYMRRFRKDCNGDGKIDCRDYMAIHMRGGYKCKGNLPSRYLQGFNKCAAIASKNKESLD